MDIRRMHWEFKERINKLDSSHKKDLSDVEIDAILNDMQHAYIEIFYSGNNYKKYKIGFEVTQQRIDMLSTVVIGQPEQSLILPSTSDLNLNIYEFDFNDLKYKYKHLLRAYYIDPSCGLFEIKIEQHDDINKVITDEFRGPSLVWKRLIGNIKSSSNVSTESSLYIYTNGVIDISGGIYIEYIKQPQDVFLGTYDSFEYVNCIDDGGTNCELQYNVSSGSPTGTISSELPQDYHTLLIDLAVQEYARRLEDVNRYNLVTDKINTNS